MNYDAIIVAGGSGKRANLGFNKVLFKMKNGKSVLESACHLFIEDNDCINVIVVTNETIDFDSKKVIVVKGGKERYESVKNGLLEVKSPYVFIHDGARPFLDIEDLNKLKGSIICEDGAILAYKAVDTIKYVKDGYIENTIDRNYIYYAQTPQAFKSAVLKKGYNSLDLDGVTDDASILEKMGIKVKIVSGKKSNIKLTNSEDFLNV